MIVFDRANPTRQFEQTLAFHCAPSMAGIKPADLVCWSGCPKQALILIRSLSNDLARSGICLRRLCSGQGRTLILVYRSTCLSRQLAQPNVADLLMQEGYPAERDVNTMLDHLALRMTQTGPFPHEVGLFLGYPVEDVEGFRQHGGQNFKFCGLWKVYSNVDQAKARFQQYNGCRQALCRRVQGGCPLGQIFHSA